MPVDRRTLEEINQLLKSQPSEEEASRLLQGLTDEELDAYERAYGGGPVAVITPPPSSVPEENPFSGLTDEDLDREQRKLEVDEIRATNRKARSGGFFDTGMGLALRGTAQGAAAIPGLVIDYGIAPLVEGATGADLPKTSEVVDAFADSLGMRKPASYSDDLVSGAFEGIGGAAGGIGFGKRLLNLAGEVPTSLGAKAGSWLGKALTAAPKTQAIAGASGGVAGEVAREYGGSGTEQVVAAMAGALAPQIAASGAAAGVRGVIRGGESGREKVVKAVEEYGNAGTSPTVGQATGKEGLRNFEAGLSRFYGSSSQMRNAAEAQGKEIGGEIGEVAKALAGETTPTQMGDRIVNEFETNFQPKAKSEISRSYEALNNILPPETISLPKNILSFVQKKVTPIKGAKNFTTNDFLSEGIEGWKSVLADLQKDIKANGGISLQGLNTVRTQIGDQLAEGVLKETKLPQKDLRAAYKALSEDARDFARKADAQALAEGKPANALKQQERAIKKAEAYFDHLESIRAVMDRQGGGERIFQSVISNTKEGATTLENVYKTLRPEAREALSGVLIRRAMRAKPSEENLVGEAAFSLNTFAQNWNSMGAAKDVILKNMGKEEAENFKRIMAVVDDVRLDVNEHGAARTAREGQTGKQMALYGAAAAVSGTLQASVGNVGAGTGAAMLAGAAILYGGSQVLAKALTNPKFVRFLGERTTLPPSILASQLLQFARVQEDPEDAELAEQLAETLGD